MSSASDHIRKLLNAHFKGDEKGFRALAWEAVERERRLNHHTVATDIERLLAEANGTPQPRKDILAVIGQVNGNLPKDKERSARRPLRRKGITVG